MPSRLALSLALLLSLGGIAAGAQAPPPPASPAPAEDPLSVVQRFIAAENRHDVDAMLAQIHPEVRWLTVDGDQILGNAAGEKAVRELFSAYLSVFPTVKKTLDPTMVNGPLVSVLENARWRGRTGELTETKLVVYLVESGKIRYAWNYTYRHRG